MHAAAMADAAWAELQEGENGDGQKYMERMLRKNAVEKKAKKTRPKKRWQPPAPPVIPAKKEEEVKPPAPPETAVALLRRLARAVQQTASEDATTRGLGLDTLQNALDQNLPSNTVAELLHSLCQPLLRRFEDPVEKLREKAIRLMTHFCAQVKDLQPHLPYLFPVLHHRGSPAKGLDVENAVFVFDLQGYDEFKRGKATNRPDLQEAFARSRTLEAKEPAEELRLLLCDLLITVTTNRPSNVIGAYLHEAMLLFAGFARDTFGLVAKRAAEGIATVCAVDDLQEALIPYACALARCCLPNLRHRHAKVRKATVDAVRRSVAVRNVGKWRGAGSDAIKDLVGFREDNVIPTHAFYGPETRYNYMAELTRDANNAVRLAVTDMFHEWFVGIADRRDHQPRLLAYILNFRIDRDEACRNVAAEALRAAGREMMGERQEDTLLEKIQYGVDGDPRCNHACEGLPWPHTERPPLEARVIVRAFAARMLQPVMDEMSSWTDAARTQSATLLQTLFVYHEDHVTEKLAKVVMALCKALKRGRNERYGQDHRASVLECGRVLGRYVVPDSFVPFLAPRVAGDLEVLPGGIDADSRADVTDLLASMIRGAKGSSVLPHFTPLSEVLIDPTLVGTTSPRLRDSALAACAALSAVVASSKDALAASFVATGRLESLEAALIGLLRAVLAWRGGGASSVLADAALADVARTGGDASASSAITKRLDILFDLADEALEDASTWQSVALREACAVSQSGKLLMICAQVAQGAIRRFVSTEDEEDPARSDAAEVVSSLAGALVPCAAAERRAAVAVLADVVLAPETMFGTDEALNARCDLASAVIATDLLDRATLQPLARGLCAVLGEPCLRGAPADGREKARVMSGAAASASILRTCASQGSSWRPTKLADRIDDVHEAVHSAARSSLNAADRLFLRDDEALRRAGADLLNAVLPTLRPAGEPADDDLEDAPSQRLSLADFVAVVASHLPTDYADGETYVDDALARLDGVLRSAAALDPAAFLETIRARPRTNVTCSLEDHAEMILGFDK